jgi:hypothetical protein
MPVVLKINTRAQLNKQQPKRRFFMATKEILDPLMKLIESTKIFNIDNLLHRPNWGSINFEAAQLDLNRFFTIVNQLSIMPLEYLSDNAVSSMVNSFTPVLQVINQIDAFKLEGGDPASRRQQIISNLHTHIDLFYTQSSPWIPFLAYQKGDVETNVAKLNDAVKKSQELIQDGIKKVELGEKEMKEIITTAREASAAAGAAVFTKDFEKESSANQTNASHWITVTTVLSIIAVLTASGFLFYIPHIDKTQQLIQVAISKIAILGILLTGTIWCGRIYKAQMHQYSINKHRALALQTFQAFSKAANDEATKNAVLMECTRSIFGFQATGYIDAGSSEMDAGSKVYEMAAIIGSNKS